MKEVKTFLIFEIVIVLLKVLGSFLCNSYALLASSVLDLSLIIVSLCVIKKGDNKKYKGIITSILGILMILGGVFVIFFSFIGSIKKVSLWLLLFIIVTLLIRYIVGCFYTNAGYQKKKGLLSYGIINSNVDFIIYGILFGTLVLSKISKWIEIFKYADRLGTILISLLVIVKGLKIIINSFKYLESKENDIGDEYKKEIVDRSEVKKLVSLQKYSFGGINSVRCDISLRDGISIIDVNTFVVTLQDYLLKIADVGIINLVDQSEKNKVKPKVRSKKQDARNSRSGNSKTNTKKKNTAKKNKKR